METFISDVSKKEFPISEKTSAKLISHTILNLIQKDNPQFNHESFLSTTELACCFSERIVKKVYWLV